MGPRFETALSVPGEVRAAANEGRFRTDWPSDADGLVNASKSYDGSGFETKPIIQITREVRIETIVIKRLTENFKVLVLITEAELPGLTVRRTKRNGSGGFTCGAACIERRWRVLGCRRH
jgi:hypothetical protein